MTKQEDSGGMKPWCHFPQKNIVASVCHDTKTKRNGGKLSSGTHIGSKARVFQSR